MAARSHVDLKASSDIIGRRLRPIYDCLDNGNNKKALQEADKVLKKQKDLHCAKVLKALALLRLGRHDESTAILQEVHALHPTDESTLQAMTICYREMHKLELIADMYQNAQKGRPDSEEILTALFMAYVRLCDHKMQQQTAVVLHKLKPNKNTYYFWAVMSIIMQAHDCVDKNLAQKMFLPLAEKMTRKFVDDNKIEAEAEVQIYLLILEIMEKWEDAVNVFEGPLSAKLVSELNYRETKAAELYMKLERWVKSAVIYKQLLNQNPDNMFWWKQYIRSVLHLSLQKSQADNTSLQKSHVDNTSLQKSDDISLQNLKAEDTSSVGAVDYTGDQALAFIQSCIARNMGLYRDRGPYLAQLELIQQYQNLEKVPSRRYGDPMKLLKNYFDMFGSKNSAFSDMKTYLEILSPEEQAEFAEILQGKVNLKHPDGSLIFVENVTQMQFHITSLQLCRYLGYYTHITVERKSSFVRELLQRYKHGLCFGKDLLSTELQFCDNYLLFAVTLMLDIWQYHGDKGIVWQVIVLLEIGLKHSPSSFQMKLLLIRLYCTLGAFGPCPALYDGMDIKHIMNDALGHIVSSHVGRLGHLMAACAMYGTMLRFFTVNHKETAEYLIASYKYGSFTKILEFVKLRDRLQNSLQYAIATTERQLLDMVYETNSHSSTEQMIMYMEIDPAKDQIKFDELCDNRDLTVMQCWDRDTVCNMKQIQERSFQEEIAWLKIRTLTMQILAASVMLGQEMERDNQTANGQSKDGKPQTHKVLLNLQAQLTDHISKCTEVYAQEVQYPLQGPFRTRTCSYIHGGFSKMFLDMLANVNYIHSLQEMNIDNMVSAKEELLRNRIAHVGEEMLRQHKHILVREDNINTKDSIIFENLVLFSELIAHLCILVGVCYRMLKPIKTMLTRRNKKKKDHAIPMPCTFNNYNILVSAIEKVTQDLNAVVRELDPVPLALDLSKLQLTEPLYEDIHYLDMEMWKKVKASYQQSVVEISEVLHKKMQYLSGLHL